MFDYDGTLAPFVVERERAFPYPSSRALLEELRRLTMARLVIVSGREVAEVRRLLDIEPPLEMWGCHGWERFSTAGEMVTGELPELSRSQLAMLEEWLQAQGFGQGIERKPASLALHWRGLPEDERQQREQQARLKWRQLKDEGVLQLHAFDGGLEWRLPHWSKAQPVETLLAETPPETPLAYFGDDLTDEDAFRALPEVDVAVLVRAQPRATAARLWLRPPDELDAFLTRLRERLCIRHGRSSQTGAAR